MKNVLIFGLVIAGALFAINHLQETSRARDKERFDTIFGEYPIIADEAQKRYDRISQRYNW